MDGGNSFFKIINKLPADLEMERSTKTWAVLKKMQHFQIVKILINTGALLIKKKSKKIYK